MKDSNDDFLTLSFPNAKVKVFFADISDEENERRIRKIKKAAAELLKEVRKRNEFISEKETGGIISRDCR